MNTTDLSKFGYREYDMAADLLKALSEGNILDDFNGDEIQLMFNPSSGFVFLTNSEYQVAMMNDDKLESFYSCPICGHEGFLEDMEHNEDDGECQEYLKQIKEA